MWTIQREHISKRVSDVSARGGAQYLAKNLILGILNVLDPDIFTGLFALSCRNTQGARSARPIGYRRTSQEETEIDGRYRPAQVNVLGVRHAKTSRHSTPQDPDQVQMPPFRMNECIGSSAMCELGRFSSRPVPVVIQNTSPMNNAATPRRTRFVLSFSKTKRGYVRHHLYTL
jgi:hypothetical protein